MATKKKMLQAAAGNAGGGGVLNVEDVFSTYLYTGTGGNADIVNNIDLAGEGGLVVTKRRNVSYNWGWFDTERGAARSLHSNDTDTEEYLYDGGALNGVRAFNSDGFNIGDQAIANSYSTTDTIASWTFRKAPKFFDVIKYSGDSNATRSIPHGLGSSVGMIIIKTLNANDNWLVYHRGLPNGLGTGRLKLNLNNAVDGTTNFLSADSSSVTFANNAGGNYSGNEYVMYLFAHNDGDGEFGGEADADIIKCGSYTGNGAVGHVIDLGFEAQWVMVKCTNDTESWIIYDAMRGMPVDGNGARLRANDTGPEESQPRIGAASQGFQLTSSNAECNRNGNTYIYMAIRRGTKVPESADEVFAIDTYGGAGGGVAPAWRSGFPVDMAYYKDSASTSNNWNMSRLTGTDYLLFDTADEASQFSAVKFDYNNGYWGNGGTAATTYSWMWKRATNYFDVVAYSGNSTGGNTVSHNLGVAPEMIWVKKRNRPRAWKIYHSATGSGKAFEFDTATAATSVAFWNNTDPTESAFSLGSSETVNGTGDDYIAYLFASLDGVSKVGGFTGNGGSQTIDCGFTSGARFVLIKKTSGTSNWLVFDTERGIVSGNDPYLFLDTSDVEDVYGSFDEIDPHPSGFTFNYNPAGFALNGSGSELIFYAIA